MKKEPTVHVREAQPEDARYFDAIPGASGWLVRRVVVEEAAVRGVGVLDPDGRTTEPDAPALTIEVFESPAMDEILLDHVIELLVESLIAEARAAGHERVTITCDPMAIDHLKRLERLGFRPTGGGPYHEYGGGYVEYISGYRDATGSMIDLAQKITK